MATDINNSVGAIIRRIRIARGLRQVDLAEAVGVVPSRISEIETGDVRASNALLRRIAKTLDAPEVLLGALRNSPMLEDALSMLGVDIRDPDPNILVHKIRSELTALEADIRVRDGSAPHRAGVLVDMCRMLTLLLATRAFFR